MTRPGEKRSISPTISFHFIYDDFDGDNNDDVDDVVVSYSGRGLEVERCMNDERWPLEDS